MQSSTVSKERNNHGVYELKVLHETPNSKKKTTNKKIIKNCNSTCFSFDGGYKNSGHKFKNGQVR